MNTEFKIKVEEQIALGNVSKVKHPFYPIYNLCYTKECQYSNQFNEITSICRGLVVNEDYNIVSYAMPKFHNEFEFEKLGIKIPYEYPFYAYEKVDGSLIHLFNYEGNWIFSSKGSFISDQAKEAEKIFHEKYPNHLENLSIHFTYVFEVIYPENRIVIDYGKRRDLILITMFDKTRNGKEIEYDEIGAEPFTLVKRYDGLKELEKIKDQFNHLPGTEMEGFVLRFDNGFRMKIKLDNYCTLHRAITGLSERIIWERLSNNESLDIYDSIDSEEVRYWIQGVADDLKKRYSWIEEYAKINFEIAKNATSNQKEFANYIISNEVDNPGILFSMYHGKKYDSHIWKLLYPSGNKIFKRIDE